MAKFAATLILVSFIISIQALPPTYDEILAAARENQWDQVQTLLRNNLVKNADFKPTVFDGVRNLKPVDGGHVYGEAEYSFRSATNVDGKTTEEKAGHKVINDDGKVKEFDFTPKTNLSPFNHQGNHQSQNGNEYSASDYSFQYAPSSPDQPTSNIIGNNNVQIGQPTNLPAIPTSFSSVPSQGAQSSHSSYNHEYSYSHSHSYVNGQPEGGLVSNGGNLPLGIQKSIISPISFTEVRDLKPPQGGQVYGEAQFQFHKSSNVNGKVSEDQGGHKVINNNGHVEEFDFTPSPPKSPVVTYFKP